jgi:hypothetical protein
MSKLSPETELCNNFDFIYKNNTNDIISKFNLTDKKSFKLFILKYASDKILYCKNLKNYFSQLPQKELDTFKARYDEKMKPIVRIFTLLKKDQIYDPNSPPKSPPRQTSHSRQTSPSQRTSPPQRQTSPSRKTSPPRQSSPPRQKSPPKTKEHDKEINYWVTNMLYNSLYYEGDKFDRYDNIWKYILQHNKQIHDHWVYQNKVAAYMNTYLIKHLKNIENYDNLSKYINNLINFIKKQPDQERKLVDSLLLVNMILLNWNL